MTEAEWIEAKDPIPMLEFLRGKVSDRKLRLFGCACCRRIWNSFESGKHGQIAVVAAELFVDGFETFDQLTSYRRQVVNQLDLYGGEPVYDSSFWVCGSDIRNDIFSCCFYAANLSTSNSLPPNSDPGSVEYQDRRRVESAFQADVLREVFGNPFRIVNSDPAWRFSTVIANDISFHVVNFDPAWLTPTVVALATGIYANRAFDRMPILADALEEAGCENADVLLHCRQPGEHVRGCWVVDLVLGKE
jgi:hypothetical protein